MAPRVLHFCKNQIAWECAGLQDAEGHPEMSPTLKAKLGDVVDEGRLKDLNSDEGLALRHIRLKGFPDPDANLEDLGIFELWKRVIEVYSRTNLTVSRDKLIALSGIARLFSQEKFKPGNRYIAGLWSRHLESQLLWQVNEQFQDGQFANPARRDATRAPSFSWASIDTPYGINYADTTDYKSVKTRAGSGTDVDASIEAMASPGRPRTRATSRVPPAHSLTGPIDGNDQSSNPTNELLFRVCDHSILLSDNDNPFGMIDSAQLLIRPRFLQKIKLHRLEPPLRVPYSWQLDQDPSAEHPKQHSNLYLDAPESDSDIFKHDAELYVMPAAYGERTTRKASRYMYCLLLKFESTVTFPQPPHEKEQEKETKYKDSGAQKNRQMGKYRGFRRFGIAKLSNHADESGQKAVTAEETDETICLL